VEAFTAVGKIVPSSNCAAI